MRMKSDMHIHTVLSRCHRSPEQTLDNIVELSVTNGLARIGLADHVWRSDVVAPSDFYSHMDGSGHLSMLETVRSRSWGVEVLVGCEAETQAPGVFGITREFKDRLDFVVMSASHFHMRKFIAQPVETTPLGVAEHMLSFFLSAISSGLPDAIVHPLFPFGYDDMYEAVIAEISDVELTDAFGLAAQNGVGIEINPCALPNPAKNRVFDLDTPTRVFSLAKNVGCKFTFGSDAHAPEELSQLSRLRYFVDALDLTESDLHALAAPRQ